ncbi:MAG TPA: UDP-N-acetylmuramate dehydrogenase [Spirochaetia bacterium]|nr:UDP-N-acetylmuramate dehydrogenase [Spirochaetia bacterium]
MNNLRGLAGKINIAGSVAFDAPLAPLTTYRVGGPADLLVSPQSAEDIVSVLSLAKAEGIPVFILGGGANILVSDRGIRGIVIRMTSLSTMTITGERLAAQAGCEISDVSWQAASAGLGGLGFIFSMPGTVGGAVWMNARCYGSSISDILRLTEYIDENLDVRRVAPRPGDFDYKRSPFQKGGQVILAAEFALRRQDTADVFREMEGNRSDRERKGHFAAPSAGSVFKNNHAFGDPSGKIIDRLGLRGFRIGGAQVSHYHANMIINSGGATAEDIEHLIRHVARRVKDELGFELEREVIAVGDWQPVNESPSPN